MALPRMKCRVTYYLVINVGEGSTGHLTGENREAFWVRMTHPNGVEQWKTTMPWVMVRFFQCLVGNLVESMLIVFLALRQPTITARHDVAKNL